MIVTSSKWPENSIEFTIGAPEIMKFSRTIRLAMVPLAAGSLFLGACSDPQKQARKGIEAKGYEATVEGLLLAASAGDVEGLGLFEGAEIEIDSADAKGNTALIKAASAGHLRAVERILGLGADPRHVNRSGRDALILASAKGHEEIARMLVGRGADTTLRDPEGWGALSLAGYNGHSGVVSLLAGVSTAAELDDALLVASFSGDAGVINTLLGQGANINARSPESKTPLMIASESGKLEAVRVLLQNQANPYAVDIENRTAANLAETAGFVEVQKLIAEPDSWGRSVEGQQVAGEMAKAQEALIHGVPVEETLADGGIRDAKPEPGSPTRVAKSDSASGDAATLPVAKTTEATAPRDSSGAPKSGSGGPAVQARSAVRSSDSGVGASRIEVSRKVREESKSKPIAALNGSTIHTRSPVEAPVKTMVLAAYHEESLPLIVEKVDGTTAEVRRLDTAAGETVAVAKGEVIPGTSYRIEDVAPRYVSSKEGKGRMVDVSRVRVADTRSGATHLLVKDASGQTSDTYAILTAPNSQYRYVVKAGDVFRTSQPDVGTKDYQVLEIRASGVAIKDLATDEVVMVARDGVIAP